jgi:methylated-DNA-[protein]-cysteine S-methyltransferase
MNLFQRKVFEVIKKIPKGRVLTYKEVAKLAGFPRAWRAVGNVLNKNPAPEPSARYGAGRNPKIPCHRVIRSDGKIGGYNRGTKKKITLLKKEGVIIKKKRVVPCQFQKR